MTLFSKRLDSMKWNDEWCVGTDFEKDVHGLF